MSEEYYAVNIKISGFSENARATVQNKLDELFNRMEDIDSNKSQTIELYDDIKGLLIGKATILINCGQKD